VEWHWQEETKILGEIPVPVPQRPPLLPHSLACDRTRNPKIKRWMKNQHLALWRGLCSAQRQARVLISGPDLATGARLLSFNKTQTKAVIGLLTGYSTLRRHLHVMGLNDNPTCRKCGTEEETSVHILCECEALAALRHTYLGFFFWTRRILGCWGWRPSGTLLKDQGSYNLVQNWWHRGPVLRPRCIGPVGVRTLFIILSWIRRPLIIGRWLTTWATVWAPNFHHNTKR